MVSNPQGSSRTRRAPFPQSPPQISTQAAPKASPVMVHEGDLDNISKDEKDFIK